MKWERRIKTDEVGIVGGKRFADVKICRGWAETVDLLKRNFIHEFLLILDPSYHLLGG